jgi:hypothetical protein
LGVANTELRRASTKSIQNNYKPEFKAEADLAKTKADIASNNADKAELEYNKVKQSLKQVILYEEISGEALAFAKGSNERAWK